MSEKEPGLEAEILAQLEIAWSSYPKQRLCQLLYNIVQPGEPCPGLFYEEDSRLLEKLKTLNRK